MTTTGRVSFVGAGPGAADLITLRGARRIAEADVVIWAPSAVDAECVRELQLTPRRQSRRHDGLGPPAGRVGS